MSRYFCIMRLVILLGCLACHSMGLGAEVPTEDISKGLPQVVQFEDVSSSVTRCILGKGGIKSSSYEIKRLNALPDVFLNTLGQYYVKAQIESNPPVNTPICTSESMDVESLVTQAMTLLLKQKDEDLALKLLKKVPVAFQCSQKRVSHQTLWSALLYSGVAKTRVGETEDGSYREDFRRAARIDPSKVTEGRTKEELTTEVMPHFDEAISTIKGEPQIRVSFIDLDMMGGELLVDGRPLSDIPDSLAIGPHFLQFIRSDRTVASATIVEIPADMAPGSVWTPVGFLPPKPEHLREMLKEFTLELRDSTLESALSLMQKEQNLPWILLVGAQREGIAGDALLLQVGERLQRIPVSHCMTKRSSLGIGLTIASSAVTVISTGIYGYYYYQGVSSPHTSVEAKQILQGVGIGRIGMIVGGSATLLAGSVTWKIPELFYPSKRPRSNRASAVLQPELYFGAGPETFAFGLKGAW